MNERDFAISKGGCKMKIIISVKEFETALIKILGRDILPGRMKIIGLDITSYGTRRMVEVELEKMKRDNNGQNLKM
jgi:hypothetical protein